MARLKKPLPVEPEPFQWWYSRDEEGPWQPGGETREIAISEALGSDTYEEISPGELDDQPDWLVGFHVCRMRRRVLDLSRYFNAADWLDDIGEQMTDEDGPDDLDGDGLSNDEEEALGTDPLDSDTDDDGLLDGDEVGDDATYDEGRGQNCAGDDVRCGTHCVITCSVLSGWRVGQ